MRISLIVIGALLSGSCSGGVTAPTPASSGMSATGAPPFGVSGLVSDTLGRPIAAARVEVLDGPMTGRSATSDDSGRYLFEPVFAAPFLARASKAGYRDDTLLIRGANAARFFTLASAGGSSSLNGQFSLTFTADAACNGIPAYARRRGYDAVSGSLGNERYLITLSGGGYDLAGSGYFSNTLYAGVFGETAQVNLSDPPVWERFPQGTYVVILGQAQGSIRELPATLSLDGNFTYCAQGAIAAEPRCSVAEISCRSSNHRLTVAAR